MCIRDRYKYIYKHNLAKNGKFSSYKMNWNQTYYALCFKALVASVYLLPVLASFSFVPLPLFIMFWQVRLFMQRDPTKIQECHLCLLIQDRATLPFLLATSRQNTNALTAPQLSPVTNDNGPIVLLAGRGFVCSQQVTCPLRSGSTLHPNPMHFSLTIV